VFSSLGWPEIVVIALVALFVFGPERLPNVAKEAAGGLKKVREIITGVRAQVDESLGDDLAHLRDLDLRQYHPRTFIRNNLLGDDDLTPPPEKSGATATRVEAARARDRTTPPPFDSDAT
jgi:sec-independent protein translocase protein TatB